MRIVTAPVLVLLLVCISLPAMAGRKSKAQKEHERAMLLRPLEVSINASPHKVKQVLQDQLTAEGFYVSTTSEESISFSKPDRSMGANAFAVSTHTAGDVMLEIDFTLSSEAGHVTLRASPFFWVGANGSREVLNRDKRKKLEILNDLDATKREAETP